MLIDLRGWCVTCQQDEPLMERDGVTRRKPCAAPAPQRRALEPWAEKIAIAKNARKQGRILRVVQSVW